MQSGQFENKENSIHSAGHAILIKPQMIMMDWSMESADIVAEFQSKLKA